MTRWLFNVLLALSTLASPATALAADAGPAPRTSAPTSSAKNAQTGTLVTPVDDPVGAKVLFDEAVALGNQGKFPEACDKLEQSQKLHDGLGTSFHLAGCWQKIGRTASAYELFADVAKRADAAGQAERGDVARSRMDALAPNSRASASISPSELRTRRCTATRRVFPRASGASPSRSIAACTRCA